MLIDREPRPLYGILERNGFVYDVDLRADFVYVIGIRHKS